LVIKHSLKSGVVYWPWPSDQQAGCKSYLLGAEGRHSTVRPQSPF